MPTPTGKPRVGEDIVWPDGTRRRVLERSDHSTFTSLRLEWAGQPDGYKWLTEWEFWRDQGGLRVEPASQAAAMTIGGAGEPASLVGMAMSNTERASKGGQARTAGMTEEQRRDLATRASAAAQSPLTRAGQLARAYADLDEDEQRRQLPKIRAVLREVGIVR